MTVVPLILVGGYVLSVVWRVSVQEQTNYGRSDLIPLSLRPQKYQAAGTTDSFGQKTYRFENAEGNVIVWRQKLNGFQHVFGSALACYELGDFLADKLFCANEFAEFTFDWNGVEEGDLLDRKKDLANNKIGRSIAEECRHLNLIGNSAEEYIARRCLKSVEHNPLFLAHCRDIRVLALSEAGLGCPGLPKRNIFNAIKDLIHPHGDRPFYNRAIDRKQLTSLSRNHQ